MNDSTRQRDPDAQPDERQQEAALRPDNFDDYSGQTRVKERLQVAVRAAKMRGQALDHVLLCGPPGLGKTTMAAIIARELGVEMHVTSGPAIDKKGDLAGIVTQLGERDVLFIDEIHRMSSAVEENLYPAMEDFRFDIILGQGAHARSMHLTLPRFTLVGATTRTGLLTSPLLGRFGIIEKLDYYPPDELSRILMRSGRLLDVIVDDDAAFEIARRSRGTPRIANRLLRRVRDYMDVEGATMVDVALAKHALSQLGVDNLGLDATDRAYLDALVLKFGGGPVGLSTMAATLGEAAQTLEDVHEPYLLQEGFLQRTPRGRMATLRAFEYLQVPPPAAGFIAQAPPSGASQQRSLFRSDADPGEQS
ncbi:MAG: Holliday junction branch migration DNA helicase RuvB [Myxococcales bacterium]|nr:Holliday junction branch migration DNA helicase RuvB [Myxococcales bacterium]